MNQKNIDVINICLDAMLAFGNEKSKADIKEAKEAFNEMAEKAIPKPPEYVDYDMGYYKCGSCGELITWTDRSGKQGGEGKENQTQPYNEDKPCQ